MHSFDLVTAPWIPVLSASGVRDVGLADAFSEDIAALATGDSYEDVALLRLMIAIAVAADAESLDPAQWVRNHTGDFDLFHPQRPFAQNADMLRFIDAGKTNPIADLSYRHGGTGKAAANMFHSHSGITLTPAETARQLVVRQCFSVPGIQPFLGNLFPAQKHPGTGKMETVLPSIAAEGTAGTLAWIEDGDLPSTLAANVAAVRGRPLGTFHFTWTHGHPPVYLRPEGVLDGLTYLARSIYVEPGTEVTRAMVCNGVRWPADKDKLGYTEDMDPELKPFALYLISSEEHNAAKRATERIVKAAKAGKKAKPVAPKTFPRRNYSSSMGRTAWRTLLRGLVDQQPPSAALSAARPGQTLRTAGIGTSNQSRIDGLFVASLPAPAEGVDPAAINAAVERHVARHVEMVAVSRNLRGRSAAVESEKDIRRALEGQITSVLDAQMYPHVCAALRGECSLSDLELRLAAISEAAGGAAVAGMASARPEAASQLRRIRDARWSKKQRDAADLAAIVAKNTAENTSTGQDNN